jgi:hypothetical protein
MTKALPDSNGLLAASGSQRQKQILYLGIKRVGLDFECAEITEIYIKLPASVFCYINNLFLFFTQTILFPSLRLRACEAGSNPVIEGIK